MSVPAIRYDGHRSNEGNPPRERADASDQRGSIAGIASQISRARLKHDEVSSRYTGLESLSPAIKAKNFSEMLGEVVTTLEKVPEEANKRLFADTVKVVLIGLAISALVLIPFTIFGIGLAGTFALASPGVVPLGAVVLAGLEIGLMTALHSKVAAIWYLVVGLITTICAINTYSSSKFEFEKDIEAAKELIAFAKHIDTLPDAQKDALYEKLQKRVEEDVEIVANHLAPTKKQTQEEVSPFDIACYKRYNQVPQVITRGSAAFQEEILFERLIACNQALLRARLHLS